MHYRDQVVCGTSYPTVLLVRYQNRKPAKSVLTVLVNHGFRESLSSKWPDISGSQVDEIQVINSLGLQNQFANVVEFFVTLIGELVGDLLCLVAAILYAASFLNRAGCFEVNLVVLETTKFLWMECGLQIDLLIRVDYLNQTKNGFITKNQSAIISKVISL